MKITHLITLFLIVLFTASSSAKGIHKKQEAPRFIDALAICDIFKNKPGWYSDLIDMRDKWGTPIYLAMAFMKKESSFIHNARPIKKDENGKEIGYLSSAYGYSQALDGTWSDFEKAIKRDVARDDFADATQFIGWYTSKSKKRLNLTFNKIAEHYLAYYFGQGAFSRSEHKGKARLYKISQTVQEQAEIYKSQLKRCLPEPLKLQVNVVRAFSVTS